MPFSLVFFAWRLFHYKCDLDCQVCRGAFRQFPFCTAVKDANQELDIILIKDLLTEIQHLAHLNLHILGGNIILYSQLDRLLQALKDHQTKYFYFHYTNAACNTDWLRRIVECGGELKLPVTFPLDTEKMKRALEPIAAEGIHFTLLFAIRNVEEFEVADEMSEKFQPGAVEFHPCYDGSNLDFFSENLFVREQDIEEERPSLKEIHARGVVNTANFGNLTISPDNRIHANLDVPSLGKLGIDSLQEILLKELKYGNSWRKVRKHVSPCKSCTFEKLCPPISNYNRVIGRYDLCHIRKQTRKVNHIKNKIKKEVT